MRITSEFWSLAPNALPIYREAFERADIALSQFHINTELRLTHFLSQVLHESTLLTAKEENLNYTVKGLMRTWKSRFPTEESARPFAHYPRALANKVYGGRNGNVLPDDGWMFRGRGMIQLTFRDNYYQVGTILVVDLVSDPDRVLDPEHSLAVAACIWNLRGCNEAADLDSVEKVTRKINGGQLGLADRRRYLARVREVVPYEV